MRVMIDTNILISAALFPNGRASIALKRALSSPFHPIVCDYVLEEFERKFTEKFSNKIQEMNSFLQIFLSFVEVVTTPEETEPSEEMIRDAKDRPIFRAAIKSDADFFLTGDKDFLESQIEIPRIVSVSDFLEL